MASLKYEANSTFQTGTLASGYTSGGTSLALTSGHGDRFPSAGDFWVRIDSEIFKCTSRTGDTLTVVGAADGTSASNHSVGATVRWVMGVAALDQLRADEVLTGAVASATATKEGNIYLPTDSVYLLRDTGAAQAYWGTIRKLTPPPSTGWTWHNQASAVVDSTYGFEYISTLRSGAVNLTGRYRTVPATPFNIKFMYRAARHGAAPGLSGTATNCGTLVGFKDAGDKVVAFREMHDGSGFGWFLDKWTSPTSFSAVYAGGLQGGGMMTSDGHSRMEKHFAIADDGTSVTFYWSIDGFHWKLFATQLRGDFLATGPAAYGVWAYTNGAATEIALLHMVETQGTATP